MTLEPNSELLGLLEEIARCGSPAYANRAAEVLADFSRFEQDFVIQLVDAYLNDPYLTKN